MLSFTYKDAAAHPPPTELQLHLFHQPQPRGQISLCFSQWPAHSAALAPICSSTHAKGSWSGLGAQRSSVEQNKVSWWVESWTPISVAPCFLLNYQPVLPNAHHCLAAFCQPANTHTFTGSLHHFAKLLIYRCVYLEWAMKSDKKEPLELLCLKQVFALMVKRFVDRLPSFPGAL